ncbi:hypothetical protein BD626DRAFT_481412 [Schizophyllum amplum]|uniref:Swi5-dependent recombination DNA repair protein 1 n=1 Tax=Schizophyllum amplum TaxID=97359 RepID=A0A550CU65_9AGAR|nr:hypothetical protein BD626DRAFT_481412 [Auriculariopsis ampla]
MTDSFNVNLSEQLLARPCFGDGTDSEASQRSEHPSAGHLVQIEHEPTSQIHDAHFDEHKNDQYAPSPNALSQQPASQSATLVSNNHACSLDAVDSAVLSSPRNFAMPCSPHNSALDTALDATSESQHTESMQPRLELDSSADAHASPAASDSAPAIPEAATPLQRIDDGEDHGSVDESSLASQIQTISDDHAVDTSGDEYQCFEDRRYVDMEAEPPEIDVPKPDPRTVDYNMNSQGNHWRPDDAYHNDHDPHSTMGQSDDLHSPVSNDIQDKQPDDAFLDDQCLQYDRDVGCDMAIEDDSENALSPVSRTVSFTEAQEAQMEEDHTSRRFSEGSLDSLAYDHQLPVQEIVECAAPSSSPPLSSSPPIFTSSSHPSSQSSCIPPFDGIDPDKQGEPSELPSLPDENFSVSEFVQASPHAEVPIVACSVSPDDGENPFGDVAGDQQSVSTVPSKRKYESDDDEVEILRHIPPPPPTTRRPTALAHKAQFKKLAKAFRPPAMKPKAEELDAFLPSSSPPRSSPPESKPNVTATKNSSSSTKKNHGSKRAVSQFKSPLTATASANVTSNVRLTPRIQELERKLQVLKRAIKVRKDGEEKTLERLVKKWTEAGREVAWEVWSLTKESAEGGDWGYGGEAKSSDKDGFGKGWGWAAEGEKDDKGHDEGDEQPGAEDDARYKDVDKVKPQQTLGTMLRHLGIAPETLGWDDNEDGFVDA